MKIRQLCYDAIWDCYMKLSMCERLLFININKDFFKVKAKDEVVFDMNLINDAPLVKLAEDLIRYCELYCY